MLVNVPIENAICYSVGYQYPRQLLTDTEAIDNVCRNLSGNTKVVTDQYWRITAASSQSVGFGKGKHCLKTWIDKGFVKAGNFKQNTNKLSYFYLLTFRGLEEKASLMTSFLKRKTTERNKIILEIEKFKLDALPDGEVVKWKNTKFLVSVLHS